MTRKMLLLSVIVLTFAGVALAQEFDPAERAGRWREFNKNNFQSFNFAKTRLTKARLDRLKEDENANDFALLRGIVFGKRGRIFKERSIQDYLDKQPWYKPNKNFRNGILTQVEKANLDLIRLAEAEKHPFVEPGDMRIWKAKPITDDNLRDYTGAELTILIAEIEAIHGKTFSEQWLQKYFDERYWYKANAAYDPTILTEIERKNIERLITEKDKN